MDKKDAEIVRQMGIDKPVMSIRHVGSRIEIHLYGEDKPRVAIPVEESTEEQKKADRLAVLQNMKVIELKTLAAELGMEAGRMKKADLIAAILEVEE